MTNPIQGVRHVFDIVKAARDNQNPFSDEMIQQLLDATVSDEKIRSRYNNFSKGYSAEELFRRIFSLLPWVRLITPLGQEQYPEVSKQNLQTPDYEITYEVGSQRELKKILVEVKLVDGNKQSFELLKNTYEVLKNYEDSSPHPLVFAVFWRNRLQWTINSIEAFSEKSSCYKISYEQACLNDLSAVFGDYSYVFRKPIYRKSRFSNIKNHRSKYYHNHEKYGQTIYEGISLDGKKYKEIISIETPVIDSAFNFEQINYKKLNSRRIEIVEKVILNDSVYVYKLSSLILGFLMKIYYYNKDDMYYQDNFIVENAFNIVDTVRRTCGGEKFYLLPQNKQEKTRNLMKDQFGNAPHIYKMYNSNELLDGPILCSHEPF